MNATYRLLLVATFIDALGYGVVGPVIPRIADEASLGVERASFLVSFASAGALLSLYPRIAFLARFPARRLLSLGSAAGGVAFLAFYPTLDYSVLLALRFVQGAAAGAIWLGALHLSMSLEDESGPGARIGGLLAAYAAGNLLGPLLGFLPGAYLPFAVLGLSLLGVALVTALCCPDTSARALSVRWSTLRNPVTAAGVFSAAVAGGGMGLTYGYYALPFSLRLDECDLPLMLTTVAVPGVIASRVAGVASDRSSPLNLVATGVPAYVAMLALIVVTDSPALWFVILAAAAIGYAVVETAGLSLAIAGSPMEERNLPSALWGLFYDIGFFVVPPLAAVVSTSRSPSWAPAPLLAVALLSCVLLLLARRDRTTPPSNDANSWTPERDERRRTVR